MALFRKDAALIAFISYLAGSGFAGSADGSDVLAAICMTCFPVNFIYSFNSWADVNIDKLSKPYRPLPSGKLKPVHALVYSCALLIISVVYPFFIYSNFTPVLLCLLLPILGLLYSARPIRLRDRPLASIFILCLGLNIPLLTGFLSNSTDFSHVVLFLIPGLYCLAVVPLKKIEEVDEDRKEGVANLYGLWGNTLFAYSSSLLCLTLLLLLFMPLPLPAKTFAGILVGSTLITIAVFIRCNRNLNFLYNTIIRMVIAESIPFLLYIKLGGPC